MNYLLTIYLVQNKPKTEKTNEKTAKQKKRTKSTHPNLIKLL
jgi:hypothetical protein